MGVPGIVSTGAGAYDTGQDEASFLASGAGTSVMTNGGFNPGANSDGISVANNVPNSTDAAQRQFDASAGFEDNFASILDSGARLAAGGAALANAFTDDGGSNDNRAQFYPTPRRKPTQNRPGGGGGTGRSAVPGYANTPTDNDQSGGAMFTDPGNVLVMAAIGVALLYFAGQS